jgi:hypothetical protein
MCFLCVYQSKKLFYKADKKIQYLAGKDNIIEDFIFRLIKNKYICVEFLININKKLV